MATKVDEKKKLTKKDFTSDQAVRWCPGCGDYAILTAVQNALAEIGKDKDDIAFISGIGCSSRFPYYMETYGFHTIHGRAPAFATGLKVANPEIDVWVISGDGDSLSIGGNHFIHSVRRNVNVKYLIFNNEIYGLTKGQYSPTSRVGTVAKSTPYGSLDRAFNPASLTIGSEATFFARVADSSPKDMKELFVQLAQHKGNAVVEILQNCVIFNDKIHADITDREVRDDHQLRLEHGKPMIFGKEGNKGIVLEGASFKVVTIGENGVKESDILVHDAKRQDPTIAFMLSRMRLPEFPVPMGIFRQVEESTYDEDVNKQVADVKTKKGKPDLQKLLNAGETWTVG
ncbi:MAG: 2-oxoacid:ferredoxin oxidoreductase subunit beta [Deltaproteobacteria bacterium]|nr:2-oxoacid:ferredoxin oxidoreductase subunit beta [Deltaproteobacteria bacterium]